MVETVSFWTRAVDAVPENIQTMLDSNANLLEYAGAALIEPGFEWSGKRWLTGPATRVRRLCVGNAPCSLVVLEL